MAKSLRSKSKRTFRSKKRENGVYAATEAARLHRLNAKLFSIAAKDADGDIAIEEAGEENADPSVENVRNEAQVSTESMAIDSTPSTRISTHGPRGSRREQWRLSKGMPARPERKGMNRQGGPGARRKAGRSKRRR